MHVHIVQDLVTNVFVDVPQHLGHFRREMWFIDWFIDCSCVEHSNLYVKADNYKKAFDEYSKRRVYECPPGRHESGSTTVASLSNVSSCFETMGTQMITLNHG